MPKDDPDLTISSEERIEIARLYRAKSDESFAGAKSNLSNKQARNSINRSWYSVMQLITAATYVVLQNKRPPQGQPNWNHKLQGNLFEEIARNKTGIPREIFSSYTNEIRRLYERREHADYSVKEDKEITEELANQCLASAEKIRRKVIELVGEWP